MKYQTYIVNKEQSTVYLKANEISNNPNTGTYFEVGDIFQQSDISNIDWSNEPRKPPLPGFIGTKQVEDMITRTNSDLDLTVLTLYVK